MAKTRGRDKRKLKWGRGFNEMNDQGKIMTKIERSKYQRDIKKTRYGKATTKLF